ncbi:hypothetical protein FACS1894191_5830 [Clostridia bacterium]|nr:hypothetical protein FACS1894191_5830 [Clostridia bacterium]
MLSKKYRFHSRGGIKYTYQKGRQVRTPKISLIYAKNIKGKQRFAVIVSKKVLKSAVGRNKIRRRVYEAIREELSAIKPPIDCLFTIYSKEIKDLDFKVLQETIQTLLKEAKIVV